MHLVNSLACNDHPWNQGQGKVQQKYGKEEAVIVGIIDNGIVQDQEEENEKSSKEGSGEGPGEIVQPGAPVNIVIKPGEVVKGDPCEREANSSCPKAGAQCNRYIHPKDLGFDLQFSEYIKHNPGSGCSQEVKKDV